LGGHGHDVNRHSDRIKAFCLTFVEPLDWQTVALWLDSLVANKGDQLLRVKGMIDVEGIAEPVVVHAVQHLFHPPVRIRAWPDGKRQSRIVFITRDLPRAEVEEALDKAGKMIRYQNAASRTSQAATPSSS
jgi:G3E family GTPase